MTHVVHVINELGWGGAENLVRGMARRLRERGWRVTICALGQPICDTEGLEVICLGARSVWDAAGYMRLRRTLRRLRPDVVHVHLLRAELWGIPAARAAGAPAVITGHCTYDARERLPLARLCSRRVVRHAAATIAISRAVARYRVHRCGDSLSRVVVVHNGVEVPEARPQFVRQDARARLGLPPECQLIGTVARLHPVKGVEVFLGAAALLARSHPRAQFLVVGGGPQEAALRQLASALGLGDRVLFTGQLAASDVPGALAAMDIFVAPSLREGLGIAVIEAMAAGRPVVASDCEGIAEVIEDGRSGLLFPPGDVRALAGKLDLLLRRPGLAQRLAECAFARARERFSLDGMVTRVEEVYRSVMARQSAAADCGVVMLDKAKAK